MTRTGSSFVNLILPPHNVVQLIICARNKLLEAPPALRCLFSLLHLELLIHNVGLILGKAYLLFDIGIAPLNSSHVGPEFVFEGAAKGAE